MSTQNQDYRDAPPRWRSYMHIGAGLVYLMVGVAVLFVRKFGTIELNSVSTWGLSGLCLLYGGFRIWRGFRDLKSAKEVE